MSTATLAPLIVLIGTKAQFIKTAPVLRELDRRATPYRLVYTGQHSETFDALEAVFGTRAPDDVLVPGTEADSAGSLLGWALRLWLAVMQRLRKREWAGAQWGVVHGDTLSTLLSAMALRLAGVQVAHIEAGLRSTRLLSPFPEEIIRRWVSRLTALHLAPDAAAVANLRGIRGRIVDTGGNSLRDALLLALRGIADLPQQGGAGGYALASLHRSENLSSKATFDLLMTSIVETARVLPVRLVLHPVTRRKLRNSKWHERLSSENGIALVERMDYVDFVRTMLGARFLMTDGGSNQEEAAMLGLPTLLLRAETERPDGLQDGSVVLSGLSPSKMQQFVQEHAAKSWTVRTVARHSPAACIVDSLID